MTLREVLQDQVSSCVLAKYRRREWEHGSYLQFLHRNPGSLQVFSESYKIVSRTRLSLTFYDLSCDDWERVKVCGYCGHDL